VKLYEEYGMKPGIAYVFDTLSATLRFTDKVKCKEAIEKLVEQCKVVKFKNLLDTELK